MDFAKFYDEQPDYKAFRTDEVSRKEYIVSVDWKARILCSLIPNGLVINNVLEIGCALGILLNNVSDRLSAGIRTGIDISYENIKTARDLYPNCRFVQGTIEDYISLSPYASQDNRIDLIILSDIVEHLKDDLTFMKSMSGISRYMLLNLPLEKCFKNRNRKYGESDPSGHLRSYDRGLALKLIEESGFEVVDSKTSVALSDEQFYEMYKMKRTSRIMSKPVPLRLFWFPFYALEDKLRLSDSFISERIYGTNYFALLRNKSH